MLCLISKHETAKKHRKDNEKDRVTKNEKMKYDFCPGYLENHGLHSELRG